ncbi:MAG: radical SAM protein [Chloroflexota bacterium]
MAMNEFPPVSLELGPIRPPSEAFSLLVRVTRNCPWNRCKFCRLYKGQKFELRPVEEVKEDIRQVRLIQDNIREGAAKMGGEDSLRRMAAWIYQSPPNDTYRNVALWLYAGAKHAFLQDANTLITPTPDLVEILRFLKETLPGIERVTSYARAHTASRKSPEELQALKDAGLSRIHIGLETGYDPLLRFMDKGVTAAQQIIAGQKIMAAGISLCEYVLLGLGGKRWWQEHAIETARVLNEINPDFIRMRTLMISAAIPLSEDVAQGTFTRLTDQEIVEEEKLFLENLNCSSYIISDHINNLLQDVEGKLPEDTEKMLAVIARFQSLPAEERFHFQMGRRLGIYTTLDELGDPNKRAAVDRVIARIREFDGTVDEETVYAMMSQFI